MLDYNDFKYTLKTQEKAGRGGYGGARYKKNLEMRSWKAWIWLNQIEDLCIGYV